MSKINLNDLDDYYEDGGYEICSSCGGSEFDLEEESQTYSICRHCGHNDLNERKHKKSRHSTNRVSFTKDDFYDAE